MAGERGDSGEEVMGVGRGDRGAEVVSMGMGRDGGMEKQREVLYCWCLSAYTALVETAWENPAKTYKQLQR